MKGTADERRSTPIGNKSCTKAGIQHLRPSACICGSVSLSLLRPAPAVRAFARYDPDMLQEEYQVTLDTFCGPMDLLLYLIRRAEVDIHDIPIARITDQYLAFLRQAPDVDIDVAGEFLVMAATLIEIKSRTLAPASKEGDADSGDIATDAAGLEPSDPRYELVQQLLAYQKYRVASDELEAGRVAFSYRFARRPARADVDAARETAPPIEIELEDAHVFDLTEAFERIMASIDFGKLGDHLVEMDETPIALHEEDLLDRLSRSAGHKLTLQEAFEGATTGKRIGLFLATLELVRQRRVTVVQSEIESPIELVLNEDPSDVLVIESDEIAHYGEKPT
jgi:segregation and condensation protein A